MNQKVKKLDETSLKNIIKEAIMNEFDRGSALDRTEIVYDCFRDVGKYFEKLQGCLDSRNKSASFIYNQLRKKLNELKDIVLENI